MRKALRLTAHATILTVAWVAVLGALVFNSYYLNRQKKSPALSGEGLGWVAYSVTTTC